MFLAQGVVLSAWSVVLLPYVGFHADAGCAISVVVAVACLT